MIAQIYIDNKAKETNQLYDYLIPLNMEGSLLRGMRVSVSFGLGNKKRLGYVVYIIKESAFAKKEIDEILDIVPTITEEMFLIIDFIKSTTNELYNNIIRTVIPREMLVTYKKEISIINQELLDQDFLKNFKNGSWILKNKDIIHQQKINHYLRKNAIAVKTIIKENIKTNTQNIYYFNPNHTYKRIGNYPFLEDLKKGEEITESSLLNDYQASKSNINTLVKHNVLIRKTKDLYKDITHVFELEPKKIVLTEEQETAYQAIKSSFNQYKTFLLKGVTGSGKTEIYIKLIKDCISNNKRVLYLVPEINLIAQTAKRLKSEFDDVAIFHSGLTSRERFDQYKVIANNNAKIILGTRSASFLPISDLGLIVVDEEHDESYIQSFENNVYYQTIDILNIRANYHQAPIVLGSATPSVLSMYKAKENIYQLLTLNSRPFNNPLPEIIFVDMKNELKERNTSIFSKKLLDLMKDRLNKNEQTMLLFNKKGYAPFVLCRNCGDVRNCPNCDISLTYYKDKNELRCHYCDYKEEYSKTCRNCQKEMIKPVGVGIEYVEEQLKKVLPTARVLRMDKNVTRTKGSHEVIWNDFFNEKADILVGTQMISKGLDFKNVTLTGVLMADLTLRIPSYLASEKTYNLLTQMSGRAGRTKEGLSIIQGYDLNHYAIRSITKDYDAFYQNAIQERKILGYTPFYEISHVLFEGDSYLKTYQKAFSFKKRCLLLALGPRETYQKKINGKYRFIVTIKYQNNLEKSFFDLLDDYNNDDIRVKFIPYMDFL